MRSMFGISILRPFRALLYYLSSYATGLHPVLTYFCPSGNLFSRNLLESRGIIYLRVVFILAVNYDDTSTEGA